jgi:hypothetical protein
MLRVIIIANRMGGLISKSPILKRIEKDDNYDKIPLFHFIYQFSILTSQYSILITQY